MQIDGYVQALREDLARIAAVGDESTARAAELLAGALESALGRRLLEALGEAALELSGQLDEGRVEVRFAGSDPELVLVRDEAEPAIEAADEAYTARISLRLPQSRSATRSSSASPSPPRRPRRPLEMPEHRFHTPDPVELEIKVPSGDIDIETVDGDESLISLDGNEKLIEMTEVRQEGRRIVVELKGKKAFGLTISIGDFSFGSGSSMRVRARVPHG